MFRLARRKAPAEKPNRGRRAGPPLLADSGRFTVFILCVLAAFSAVGTKLWWLHVKAAPKLRAEAEAARRYSKWLSAERGRIVDSNGGVLATSREVWDIGVDPNDPSLEEERLEDIAERLAPLIHVSKRDVLAAFNRKFREDPDSTEKEEPSGAEGADTAPVVAEDERARQSKIRWIKLAEGVDLQTREAVAALRVKAVYSVRRFVREYPRGRLAAHLVGYVNKEGEAAMGIEKALDFFLKGEDGWIDSRWNARRQEMADRRIREVQPRDGLNVELTLDPIIQEGVEAELNQVAEEYKPLGAIAIVSEAKTGKLLALANWPSFDLNEFSDLTKSPLAAQRNRAVTDVYEPGSVFKIVSYCAGIQEGMFTPTSLIDCSLSSVQYHGKMMDLPADSHHMGVVDMRHAVWQSSNRAASQIGMKVAELRGERKLWEYITDFGFGSVSGLITGTEVPGLLAKPEKWGVSVTRIPMGHSVSVTAMQMHYGMSVVASKGVLFAPMLVGRIVARDGTVVMEPEPAVRKRNVISRATAETVIDMLRGVVSKEGTAKEAIIPGYDVAGKTGTTKKIIDGKYSSAHHVASFSGFFPASDPRVVITVIIDEPGGKGIAYGGVYSAPVFRRIAERVIRRLEIPPANPAEAAAALEKDRKRKGLPAPAVPVPAPGALLFDSF